jgi:hypothetical protein
MIEICCHDGAARYSLGGAMKAYLITTGLVFSLITIAHMARVFAEGLRMAREPFFVLLTLLAAGLSIWAWYLLKRSSNPR